MKDCEKLKKRFYIGLILIFMSGFLKVINMNFFNIIDILGVGVFIGLGVFLGVLGLYFALPYVRCISNNKNLGVR